MKTSGSNQLSLAAASILGQPPSLIVKRVVVIIHLESLVRNNPVQTIIRPYIRILCVQVV